MTAIVKVAIGLAVGMVVIFTALLLVPKGGPSAPGGQVGATEVSFDEDLARRGEELYGRYGCSACHSVSSLGVSGGSAGPDLSRALFGEGTGAARPLPRWYSENGLSDPRSDPDEAAELLAEYLEQPPTYSPLMQGQIQRLKSAAGEEQWEEEAEAMAEFLKKAAGR
jgi:hypothetical protein